MFKQSKDVPEEYIIEMMDRYKPLMEKLKDMSIFDYGRRVTSIWITPSSFLCKCTSNVQTYVRVWLFMLY